MDIGFLGLGAMGRNVAANLLQAGHRVRVWNRSPGSVEALVAQGAERAESPADAFRGDAVLSMLADDRAVREVVVASGALEQAPRGLVHVNLATVSVALADELEALHRARGVGYVAAPVFGRPEAAAARKLFVVAAGEASALARVQALFEAIGQKAWTVGEKASQANVVKLAGNFMIASAIESMSEAVTLAEHHGIAAAQLLDVLTGTLFGAPVFRTYGALIAEKRYEPAGFKARLGLKDVRLALEAGDGSRVPMPFASVLRDAFLEALAHGDGERDWASIAEVARRRAGG